jgi:3-methylcrotonyl-CoA carboxylase alpha subunit
VTITPLGSGRYELVTGSGRLLAYAVRRGGETWVFLGGRTFVIAEQDGQAGRSRRQEDSALAPPMPATVVAIAVTPGQRVQAGDALIVLEAMKMELAITAPHDGRIRRIACRVGELVQPGVPLVEFEDAPPDGQQRHDAAGQRDAN